MAAVAAGCAPLCQRSLRGSARRLLSIHALRLCRQSSLDGSAGAAAAAEAASVAADLEGAEKAKRKGRFRYVEDDFGDSKARLGAK